MALLNRRTGIAGITLAALACLVCGIPVLAALLGISGVTLGTVLSDSPTILKFAVSTAALVIIIMLINKIVNRHSKLSSES